MVGNARNCGKWITTSIGELQRALTSFRKVQWLIVESDSDDDTPAQLDTLASSIPDFHVTHLGRLRDTIPRRTERLAHCRNTFLTEIKTGPQYADADYVLVADLDGLTGALTARGVESCWERDDWDVCTANQRGPYYDIWTLRHPFWSPNDCWKQYRVMLSMGVAKDEAQYAAVNSRKVTIPERAEWIEVESAFGGLAIYRRSAIVCGAYHGLSDEGEEVSDHMALHRGLRARGFRIMINPRLINTVGWRSPDQKTALERLERTLASFTKQAVRSVFGEDAVTRVALMLRRLRK